MDEHLGGEEHAALIVQRGASVVHTDVSDDRIIVMPLEQAIEEHPDLVEPWFAKRLPHDEGKFPAGNAAFWTGGVFVHVPPDVQIDKPIQAVWLIDEPGTVQWAHTLVVVGEHAECKIREYFLAPDFEGQALHAGAFELYAQPGAQVNLAHYQDWGAGEVHDLSVRRVEIGRDARVKWVPIHLGGRLTKQTLDIVTAEQGSDMRHTGMYFTERDEHLDLFTTDRHEAGHTTGDTVWKGALTGSSRASYEGLIHILPGAPGDGHLPPDPPDPALAQVEGRRDPLADRGDRQRQGVARRHRRRARPGPDLLHDDPRPVARRGGAGAGGGVLRGGRAAPRGPGTRGPRPAPDRREAEGRRGPGARVHRGAGRGRLMGAVTDSPLVRLRADFPVLEREINGHPLVYLDSAASSQKPRQVIEAMDRFYSHSYGTVHRGVYELGREATELFEGARERIAAFVGWDTDCSIFTRNATEAINLVAYAWGRGNVGAGDEVLITEMEHHSNIVPWQLLCEETGARLRYLSVPEGGELSLDELDSVLAEGRVKLVAVAHVSNVLGTINPVEEIVRRARAAGALTLVDGAQSVPQMPVDLRAVDADFYAWTGHKALGPTVGLLHGRRELLKEMRPFLGGGHMISRVEREHSTWNELPWKFEAGTNAIAEAIGLGAAVDYLSAAGMENVRAHERDLTAYALERLPEIDGLTLYGPTNLDRRGGVVPFTIEGMHPHDIAELCDREAVCVRAGHHCAQPLMRVLRVGATARASFHVYNSREDVDRLVHALHGAREVFGLGG